MTFEQLEFFIAVAEHDTFLDAADSMHISQSNLSKQIMKLEGELDIPLLDRSRRSAALTEAGQMFYQDALSLNQQYQSVIERLQTYKKNLPQELRIGTLPILTQYRLTPLFKEFTKMYPEIHISIAEAEELELREGFAQDKYDLIIARESMIDTSKCTCYQVAVDELMAILPSGHPAAKRYAHKNQAIAVSLEELAGEPFILMNPYTSIYKLCMEQFDKSRIPATITRTARVESIISAVAVHEGISLLPKSNFEIFHHENVEIIPLEPKILLPVVLAEKKKHALVPTAVSRAAIKKFIKLFTCNSYYDTI